LLQLRHVILSRGVFASIATIKLSVRDTQPPFRL